MKRTMKAAMLLCTLAAIVITVGCSSDKNETDHQKSAEQVLKNMVGSYDGTLGFSYGTATATSSISGWKTSWKVDEKHIITIDKFPYHTLANGVSKNGVSGTESPLHAALLNVGEAPLKITITGIGLSDSKVSLSIYPEVKFNITLSGETYELTGSVNTNKPVFSNYYMMSSSEMQLEFTVEKLVRINKEHGTSQVQTDFDMPVTYELKANKK